MAAPSYLFYDIETTGLSPSFSQVLQFAAIRTDLELNELERHEIKIALNNDVVPDPAAILVHGIGIDAMLLGENEHEGIKKIHALLNTPNTCSLGYNTLGFDDEFLRLSFFRNCLPPYTHQFANGCWRADIFPITALYAIFSKESLSWPIIDDKISLKLENLSRENQLASGPAHDAMVDVEATLALARRLKSNQPMWQYAMAYFNKKTDAQRMQALPCLKACGEHMLKWGLMVDGKFGHKKNFMRPAVCIGSHRHYKNQTLWITLDHPKLFEEGVTDEGFHFQHVIRKKAGEAPLVLPPSDKYLQALSAVEREQMQKNSASLNTHLTAFLTAAAQSLDQCYPDIPFCDEQASLYTCGFASPDQTQQNKRFVHAAWEKKGDMLSQMTEAPYANIARRLIGRFNLEMLDAESQAYYMEYLQSIWLAEDSHAQDSSGKTRRIAHTILQEIKQLKADASDDQQPLLQALEEYVLGRRQILRTSSAIPS